MLKIISVIFAFIAVICMSYAAPPDLATIPETIGKKVLSLIENSTAKPNNTLPLPEIFNVTDYYKTRDDIINKENFFGSNLVLETEDERTVNSLLMKLKRIEYAQGVLDGGKLFGASAHFFHNKELIEASNIYKIIRALPKGGSLHVHETNAADANFIVKNLTYADDLYYCSDGHLFRYFSADKANVTSMTCSKSGGSATWQQISEMRAAASSNAYFDEWLFSLLSLVVPSPERDYADINTVWKKFEEKVTSTGGIVKNTDAREIALASILQEAYDDNIMYMELRSGLSSMYSKTTGQKIPVTDTVAKTIEMVEKFKKSHPNFIGVKYIFTTHRNIAPEGLEKTVKTAKELMTQFPDFVAGFDLVGQEDTGNPLSKYVKQLLPGVKDGVKYYFHAGETDWKGSHIDDNLLDAILLKANRLGHGFSLPGRPDLLKIVKERKIAIEICPISNQVLGLIEDFRNHPGSTLLRVSAPVVVSSDDPGVWGAKPLSHDWYLAFMALGGERDDLRFLKQLAINSIELSAMNETEKATAMDKWKKDWDKSMKLIVGWPKERLTKKSEFKDFPFVSRSEIDSGN